ncbi:hypothetical protein HZC20_02725 [Candidatus Peregrinibacteria bacterium]|nr:hypothetical protein [Candidatus Peregrinibacteria bacterium]
MDKLTELLKKIGFSERECRVYLSAFSLGAQPASVIARKAKLNRVTSYVILRDFAANGFAKMIIKRGVQFFSVITPSELVNFAENKSAEWKVLSNDFLKSLPEFLQYGRYSQNLPKVSFYEGASGIKEVYADTLKNGNEILGFLTVERIPKELRDYFVNIYTPKRIKKKIKCRMILSDSKRAKNYAKGDRKYLRKTYILPKKYMPFETEISIYGKDRVAIIAFTRMDLNAVIIQNKRVYNTLKSIFLFCETIARKL